MAETNARITTLIERIGNFILKATRKNLHPKTNYGNAPPRINLINGICNSAGTVRSFLAIICVHPERLTPYVNCTLKKKSMSTHRA